jgi:hypothetical protein
LAVTALAANPDAVTDRMSDDELRAFRDAKITELRQRLKAFKPAKTQSEKKYDGIFFCTLYYTPKESGFTAARGFGVTPVRGRGLGGRTYARDFLRAVKKEGFGRLIEAVNGRSHIRWLGGSRYGFANAPVGRHGEALISRRSCAISHRNPFLHQHDKLRIQSETVKGQIRSEEWIVTDSGPAVHQLQIDLYWGEDEPRGAAGRQPARPAGAWMEYAFETSVTAKR